MSSDLEQLQELYDLMLERNLDALEVKDVDARIKLVRQSAASVVVSGPVHAAHASHAPAPKVSAAASAAGPVVSVPSIESPLAGVFYRASSPTTAPFTKEGDVVEASQTLCIVEAMKVMNEIKAESRCKIIKIVAENGRSVSAGQPLFHIEPVS